MQSILLAVFVALSSTIVLADFCDIRMGMMRPEISNEISSQDLGLKLMEELYNFWKQKSKATEVPQQGVVVNPALESLYGFDVGKIRFLTRTYVETSDNGFNLSPRVAKEIKIDFSKADFLEVSDFYKTELKIENQISEGPKHRSKFVDSVRQILANRSLYFKGSRFDGGEPRQLGKLGPNGIYALDPKDEVTEKFVQDQLDAESLFKAFKLAYKSTDENAHRGVRFAELNFEGFEFDGIKLSAVAEKSGQQIKTTYTIDLHDAKTPDAILDFVQLVNKQEKNLSPSDYDLESVVRLSSQNLRPSTQPVRRATGKIVGYGLEDLKMRIGTRGLKSLEERRRENVPLKTAPPPLITTVPPSNDKKIESERQRLQNHVFNDRDTWPQFDLAWRAMGLRQLKDPEDLAKILKQNTVTRAQQSAKIADDDKKANLAKGDRALTLYRAVHKNRRLQKKAREELRKQEDKAREEAQANQERVLFGNP